MPLARSSTIRQTPGNLPAVPNPVALQQSAKRKPLGNAIWNWLGMGVEMAIALFLMPFLIHRLGEAAYGAWIIIGSFTGYLGNLDFGMRSSVGRHLALYHARNDRDGVLSVINSAGLATTVI